MTETAMTTLGERINAEHEAADKAARQAVQHALKTGELLLQAKGECAHGQWLPWIKENTSLSERTAQSYMRLARQFPKLDAEKAQRVADLPLREALKALSAPEPEPYPCPVDMTRKGEQISAIVAELAQWIDEAQTAEELQAISELTDRVETVAVQHRLRAEKAIKRLQREIV